MTTLTDHLLLKELFLRFTVGVFREHIINECVCVCASFPFGFEGGMWHLIVLKIN